MQILLSVLRLFAPFLILSGAAIVIGFVIAVYRYRKTLYCAQTHNSFFKVHFDKGLYGEYLTYLNLKKLPGVHRFLFNVYIPKKNEETTEIDVLLIHESGLYVFESKNYSGWIFGTENQRQWTQSLPSGRKSIKTRFFNPIMQNELHIKWLKALLTAYPEAVYHSVVLFSDRCELKKLEMTEHKADVIKRQSVMKQVLGKASQTGPVFSEQQIIEIDDLLYPYTQVSGEVKQKHIDNIRKTKDGAGTKTAAADQTKISD